MAAKKSKKSAGKTVSKSAFVRDLPVSMPAKEVSARAKAAGLTISDRYVHVIRSIAKHSGKKAGKAGAPAGGRRGGRPISGKRAFVLALPADVPATEVVKQAKAQGMKLSTNYVYKIRSRGAAGSVASAPAVVHAGGAVAPKRRPGRPPGRPSNAARAARAALNDHDGTHEERFLAIVLDVGLARAAAMLERVRAKLKDLTL